MLARISGKTALGERVTNEDTFLVAHLGTGRVGAGQHRICEEGVLLVLSDGMGGASFGEVASELAVSAVHESIMESWVASDRDTPEELQNDFRKAFARANQAVRERSREDPRLQGMGATLTGAVLLPGTLVLAQVGDSRCYVCREGLLEQVTDDQTVVADMVANGQITPFQAEDHPKRNLLSQAIGYENDLRPQFANLPLRPGDRVLLCSDGLTDVVPDDLIREVLGSESDPGAAGDRLVEIALDRAEQAEIPSDNVTVLVAFVSEDPSCRPPRGPAAADDGRNQVPAGRPVSAGRGSPEPEPDRMVELSEQILKTLRSLELMSAHVRRQMVLVVALLLAILLAVVVSIIRT